jgi:hypothetical protein
MFCKLVKTNIITSRQGVIIPLKMNQNIILSFAQRHCQIYQELI